MNNKARLALVVTLLLLASSMARPAPADALGERLVLAFYYAWFGWDVWESGLPDQPLQPYVSTDPAAVERHVLWAQQAGIDAFVQSWYGPQVENNQTEPNLALLLDIAQRHGFQAAVDFETTSPFFQTEQDVVEGLRYLLDVHANHPAYLRVGGRPVVFFWRQNRFPVDWWVAVRERLDPHHLSIWIMEGVDLGYLGPFDGTHLYSVAWDPNPGATLRRWGERIRRWNAEHGSVKYWVATVMPGYHDLVTGRPDAFVRDRADGAYYRDCWAGAIQSGADMVVITSFNEWPEGSYIEPSVVYGDFYLGLTRELGDLYRASEPMPYDVPGAPIIAGSVAGPTPTVTPTVALTPPATPTGTPLPTPTATVTAAPLPTSPPPRPTSHPAVTPTDVPTPTPSPPPAVAPSPPARRAGASGLLAVAVVAVGLALVLGSLLLGRRA
ncbi:MAG: hypothetical protein JW900_04275 [Anaerolineae bacterium]|nr:hypothetical protein [Anaerolineae bacterium]